MSKPASIGSLADPRDVRSLWRETTESLETACGWKPVTPPPEDIAHLTASAVSDLCRTDDVNSRHLLTVWNQWAVLRSFEIADNIGRMRGLLCCLRYWRQVQRDNPDDIEACKAVLATWAFCRDHWGIQQPPADSRLWESYCESHVLAMRDRKERQACR